jgi:hypothetical protein
VIEVSRGKAQMKRSIVATTTLFTDLADVSVQLSVDATMSDMETTSRRAAPLVIDGISQFEFETLSDSEVFVRISDSVANELIAGAGMTKFARRAGLVEVPNCRALLPTVYGSRHPRETPFWSFGVRTARSTLPSSSWGHSGRRTLAGWHRD